MLTHRHNHNGGGCAAAGCFARRAGYGDRTSNLKGR